MAKLGVMQPLPLAPAGSVIIGDGVAFSKEASGSGAIFVWGQATWSWDGSDPGTRRLAAVQLVNADVCRQRDVATAFGVNETTVWRWQEEYAVGGMGALLPIRHGPKSPSKLTEAKAAEIQALRDAGKTIAEVAAATGVSTFSVRRVTGPARAVTQAAPSAPVVRSSGDEESAGQLVPLAKPTKRTTERAAASVGLLDEAAPVITQGSSLPLVGSLLILPALAATGLIEAATAVYGVGRKVAGVRRSAFYGLRSLILCAVLSSLAGEPRAEGATRLDPVAVGRLLGLDRAPEVKRLRFRIAEIAGEHRADQLGMTLARHHVASHAEAVGLLYVDGHVLAYHGGAEIPKTHVARIRLAMPVEVDSWITDRFGDGLLVWQLLSSGSLPRRRAQAHRGQGPAMLGPDARPTLCFDRGAGHPSCLPTRQGRLRHPHLSQIHQAPRAPHGIRGPRVP
ncbi:MAG: putative transposase [Acidimicrobiales bacterium]